MEGAPSPPIANQLHLATSPYLRQHSSSLVAWQEWNEEALQRALTEDKPIMLSIGYKASPLCHVMARESFEDPTTAAMMNAHFVNIMADRDERPDLVSLYMSAVQAFARGQGGWPMTLILTPDGRPFFAGTFFPREPSHGIPALRQVLDHAARLYAESRDEVQRVTADVVGFIERAGQLPAPVDAAPPTDWASPIAQAVAPSFDATHGGFGSAPKTPPPAILAVLLLHWYQTGDRRARRMVETTLDGMMQGGLHDLVGGGFFTASADVAWGVPRAGKLLSDNALLVPVYLDAAAALGRSDYTQVARDTLDWALSTLKLPGGAFAAAMYSENKEQQAAFYGWTPAQLRAVLEPEEAMRAAALLQVVESGSFAHGASMLRLDTPLEHLPADDAGFLSQVLPSLRDARRQRPAPHRDDQVVCVANALMVSALTKAGAQLTTPAYVDAAVTSLEFVLDHLVVDGRLHRTWHDGRAGALACADDHAALVLALLDVFEVTGHPRWIEQAQAWSETLGDLFWNNEADGLFYTGHDTPALLARTENPLGVGAPSPNGLGALAFARLAVFTGDFDAEDRADAILARYQPLLQRAPRALGIEAIAWAWRHGKVQELAVVGDDAPARVLLQQARQRYRPLLATAHASRDHQDALAGVVPWLANRFARPSEARAYLCEGHACRLPVVDPGSLSDQLDASAPDTTTADLGEGRRAAPLWPAQPELWHNTAEPLTVDQLRGRVVLLDFFTQCCVNCLHVLPELHRVHAATSTDNVVVMGVHTAKFDEEKTPESVAAAIERLGIRHPVISDPDRALWSAYGVQGWPTLVLLDREGRIAWEQPGEVSADTLLAEIEALLDESEAPANLAPLPEDAPPIEHRGEPLRHPGKLRHWPGPAAQAAGDDPFAPDARLYIADTGHHRIIECSIAKNDAGWPVLTATRTFGTGEAALRDGGPHTACFRSPNGLDRSGDRLWVADTGNHSIRELDLTTGAVTTVAGTGTLGDRPREPAAPTDTPLRSPWDVVVAGPDAHAAAPGQEVIFVAMAGAHQVWAYVPHQQRLAPFVGTGQEAHIDGATNEAALSQPSGLCLYGRYLFIVDAETSSVRVLDLAARTIGTVVGQGLFDFGDVDGTGAEVRLQHPMAVTVRDGVLYVADTYNHKVKAIQLNGGRTTTLTGGSRQLLAEPTGITVVGGFLLIADTHHHAIVAVDTATGELRPVPISGLEQPAAHGSVHTG